jgi:tripartite-type tricarboxylate transporter receptor subunit TctC
MATLGRRATLGGAIASVAAGARAAGWPERPLTWVVPFPAGGPSDVFARPVAAQVAGPLGETIVIDNRGGAGGTIAALQVARAPADGYTMIVGSTGLSFAPLIYPRAGFELARDFVPITAFARVQSALVINSERLEVKTLKEFIDTARAKPGSIEIASPGLGTVPHLAIVNFQPCRTCWRAMSRPPLPRSARWRAM